ncbi:MAG: sarcosine oxidase subunit gamma SoxG [Thermodesulfobacteriota bacterium]|nr:sarcosine oxidase subunit gamma SoxG [Thermodesulfobacteriota bacterium]
MTSYQRLSPVSFSASPVKTENRDNWTVVLEYEGEGDGPWLIDLSHRAKWDLQDGDIAAVKPWGIAVPEKPGQCILENGVLINRMNRTQASIWHLTGNDFAAPDSSEYTDTTDATLFLALAGKRVLSITEKLTSLDLIDPEKKVPFLLQGPLSHVPCQVVVLDKNKDSGTVLLTCSRGYAHDMTHAILEAGEEFGLRPAGENAFQSLLKELSV